MLLKRAVNVLTLAHCVKVSADRLSLSRSQLPGNRLQREQRVP